MSVHIHIEQAFHYDEIPKPYPKTWNNPVKCSYFSVNQAEAKAVKTSQRVSELEQDAKKTAKRASMLTLEVSSLLSHHGEPTVPIASDPLDAFEQSLRSLKKLKKSQAKQSPTKPEMSESDVEKKLRKELHDVQQLLEDAKDDVACMKKDRARDKETIEKLNAQLSKLRRDAADGKKGKKKVK